jgi:RNA polymerase sigma factor (TIGR02999 family)
MALHGSSKTTEFLRDLSSGDSSAADRLMPLVYTELREIAQGCLRNERPGHTLQPTALVHEVFIKLVDQTRVNYRGRTHFLALSAQAMRRILVDHARGKARDKRGGGRPRIELDESLTVSAQRDEDLLALDEALEKLAKLDPRQAKIVEMRFFGGMTVEEVAEALGVSKRTIESEWTMVRAWLRREMSVT